MRSRTLLRGAKRSAKLAVAGAVYYSGLLRMYRRRATRGHAVILLYHRVTDGAGSLIDYAPSGMTVTADGFDRQMAYLKRHYSVVPLSDLIGRLEAGKTPGDAECAITFDDGWRDNYSNAFPILRRYGLPATVFLTTNFIDGDPWFWEERLKYLLAHLYQRGADPTLRADSRRRLGEALGQFDLAELLQLGTDRLPAYLTGLVNQARARTPEWREDLLGRLEALLQRPGLEAPRRFLNWREIEEMSAGGVEFGAHTASHLNFERCSPHEADLEIRRGKYVIEKQLARPVSLFAYPYGKHTEPVRELVGRAGFRCACTTRPGLVSGGADLFRLNRVDVHRNVSTSVPVFACRMLRLAGVF